MPTSLIIPNVALIAVMQTFWRLGDHHTSLCDLLAEIGRYCEPLLGNLATSSDPAPDGAYMAVLNDFS
ncbi:hypothetical protein [Vreelandella salicampi]|uniref:Uncharacterized protein n=1 Tax=Vreelandella salicampi TaxID=1449798 RepID=A0A7Z0LME6_9GAMM|nr:hypothetical protein [Halomonas salicampi]NYS61632.1 hypothetical protein [Halomonas salicampi]